MPTVLRVYEVQPPAFGDIRPQPRFLRQTEIDAVGDHARVVAREYLERTYTIRSLSWGPSRDPKKPAELLAYVTAGG